MKKLLSRIIFGFSLGVTLLVLSYISIYYIDGQETFNKLLLNLTNVTTFQNQILAVGFAGIALSFVVYLIEQTLEEDKQSASKCILSVVLLLICTCISMFFIKNINVFNESIVYMLIVFIVALFAMFSLFHCVQETIDEFILNKKLKEKNNHNHP